MEQSKLFQNWIENYIDYEKNMETFIKDERKITEFTKEEIFVLSNFGKYKESFEDKILKYQLKNFYQMLTEEEFIRYMEGPTRIKEEIFLFLLENHYTEAKKIFNKLKENGEWGAIFFKNITKIIKKKISLKEGNFLEFLILKKQWKFLEDETQPYYELVKKEFINQKENIENTLKHLNVIFYRKMFQMLRILKDSIYFEELFPKYKKNFYEEWLSIINIDDICEENKDILETIILIIEDTLRLAQKELWDIKCLCRGGFKQVYEVGDFVIKIGDKGIQENILYDKSFVYPICRKYVSEIDLAITIMYLGDTKSITEEDIYNLYKDIRDRKRDFVDIKKENVVRLLKDNGSYPFEVEPETLGFIGKKEECLKAGECAICDIDLLYEEGKVPWKELEENLSVSVIESHAKYEHRYQLEKKLRK